jgi:hypothetical protein
VFTSAFIYDVLCNLFYLAALGYYVRIRERDKSLTPVQLGGCLALYICALNSKEMAVSLPVIVLLYELVKYYQHADRKPLLRWIRSDASPALVGGLITAIYVHGRLSVIDSYNKTYGPHGGFEGYTALFLGRLRHIECQIHERPVLLVSPSFYLGWNDLGIVGSDVPLRFLAAGPHARANGILGCDHAASVGLYFGSGADVSKPPSFRVGDDFVEASL